MKDTSLRALFPFFQHSDNRELVYFDSAATTQKPQSVLDAIVDFYSFKNTNVHRASHRLATQTTNEFERAREFVQNFIGASQSSEVIFTKGATESINLVAKSLVETDFNAGDRILVSATEHHANLVPWQQLAKTKKLHIDVIPVDSLGNWQVDEGLALISPKTRIVALGMVSNALGTINPIDAFLAKARALGILSVIDAAQAVAHMVINVKQLDCDFLVFSGHKAYSSTGLGVLYGKQHRLAALPVFLTGGEMIKHVDYHSASFQSAPFKFEAGTPNIEGVLTLQHALQFIASNRQQIHSHEVQLTEYLLKRLKAINGITIYGNSQRIATASFTVKGYDSQDLGTLMNEQGIAVRVGHHCAMPLMKTLGITGTLRISMACYNHIDEIDTAIDALHIAMKKLAPSEQSESSVKPAPISSLNDSDHPLATKVKSAKGWDSVYREIMLAGKSLPRLGESAKTEQTEVLGCESQVWLVGHSDEGQNWRFEADATGKIVRGLIAIMLEPAQHQHAQFIRKFDFHHYLKELGLNKHISESRGNGLASVASAIKAMLDNEH